MRCLPCHFALYRARYRATHQRANNQAVIRCGAAIRTQAVATGAWIPVAALQEAIATAQAQRTARDAYLLLRRRMGVPSPEAAVLYLHRRLFAAVVLAIPADETMRDEQDPIVLRAPQIVRRRAGRRGSTALAVALVEGAAA